MLSKDDPVVRQFISGLEAWERPFEALGAIQEGLGGLGARLEFLTILKRLSRRALPLAPRRRGLPEF